MRVRIEQPVARAAPPPAASPISSSSMRASSPATSPRPAPKRSPSRTAASSPSDRPADVRNLVTSTHAGRRRAAHDGGARLHRRALPSERRRRVVRRQHQPPHGAGDSGGNSEKVESQAAPEVWITGFMFDDTKLDRPLTRKEIWTRRRQTHPVSVAHRGGHTTSTTAKRSTWPASPPQTPDPPDGRFFREERRAERPRG